MKTYIENTYTIRINDSNILYIKGKEDINIKMINTVRKYYTCHIIGGVLYVPRLKKNLLLIGCASEKRIRNIFKDDGQSIYFHKNNKLIVKENKLK